jgi:nucleoside-diphosphate-sugar epimerase
VTQPLSYAGVRALVLGSTGFIGRWVARALDRAGAEVVLHGRDAGRLAEVALSCESGAPEVACDVLGPAAVDPILRAYAPDIVFNLTGYGVDRAERDETMASAVNHQFVRSLALAIARSPATPWSGARLVHAGSALEYGLTDGTLVEDTPANPTTMYGRTKLAGTRAIQEICAASELRAVTARLFTVYGAGEHPGRLLPSILEVVGTDRPVPLTAGLQRRDFTYVEDVAEGLLRLGAVGHLAGEVVNLATGQVVTVREFAERAARALGIPPERLRFGAVPARDDEMPHVAVGIERLRQLTGWVPTTSIESGVLRTRAALLGSSAA